MSFNKTRTAISAGLTAATLGLSLALAPAAHAQTAKSIQRIQDRGSMVCPAPTSPYLGFFELDDKGSWHGFDVDICKAVASAILGHDPKVEFSLVSWADRFPALQSSTIDLIAMLTGWTLSRDTKLGLQFSQPYYFAGVRLMAPAALELEGAKDLDGATICSIAGSTGTRQLTSYLEGLKIDYKPLTYEKMSDLTSAYKNGRCDAISAAGPGLAAVRANELSVDEHVILPDEISMEPISIAVRQQDTELLDVANWTLFALLEADRLGITRDNADALRKADDSSQEVKYLLGATPGVGGGLGLEDDWAYNVIKTTGSYSEIYTRNLGKDSPYKMPEGANALTTQGGLLYPPAFD